MSRTLPVILSIPHGGLRVPPELAGRVAIGYGEILDDADAFTAEIYHPGALVGAVVMADVARVFVDLNRAPGDLPPGNPDGAVKTLTSYRRPVFAAGREPDAALMRDVLERHHAPYHARLADLVRRADFTFGIDCHSMAPVGPPLTADAGKTRPLFCLSNAHGASCDDIALNKMAGCLAAAFEIPAAAIAFNTPFAGGYITRHYGRKPLPWMQIEMSRALYRVPPWFEPVSLRMDAARLVDLNRRFRVALQRFLE